MNNKLSDTISAESEIMDGSWKAMNAKYPEFKKEYDNYLKKHDFEIKTDASMLYHYTSFEGLKGILEYKRLWFTNYASLNDPSEIQHSMQLIEEAVKNKSSDILKYFLFLSKKEIENRNIYTFSFCKDKKDHLPTWNRYGDKAAGFTLGFKPNNLISEFSNNDNSPNDNSPNDNSPWKLTHYAITYEKADFQAYADKILSLLSESLTESTPGEEREKIFKEELAPWTHFHLLPLLPQCKHDAYKEEHEYRFVLFEKNIGCEENQKINESPKKTECGYFLRPNGKNKPFVDPIPTIKSKEFSAETLVEIGIGPACNKKQARYHIEKLLEKNFDPDKIDIYDSVIPFRG